MTLLIGRGKWRLCAEMEEVVSRKRKRCEKAQARLVLTSIDYGRHLERWLEWKSKREKIRQNSIDSYQFLSLCLQLACNLNPISATLAIVLWLKSDCHSISIRVLNGNGNLSENLFLERKGKRLTIEIATLMMLLERSSTFLLCSLTRSHHKVAFDSALLYWELTLNYKEHQVCKYLDRICHPTSKVKSSHQDSSLRLLSPLSPSPSCSSNLPLHSSPFSHLLLLTVA